MNDNDKILNDLETAKKQLEEGLQNEFDPQIRMEYEEELKSIVEQIEEMQNNYEITSDSDEELENDDSSSIEEESIDEEENEDKSNSVEEELDDEKNEDENIIDAEYYEIHDIDSNEKLSHRAARLAKDYTLAQAENLKINAKTFAHNKTEQAKNYVHTKVDNAKNAVLNSRPLRFARGVKNVGKKVFRGFKTAGTIALGVGALSVEAVQRAKNTVEKVGPESLKNIVNTGRENANSLLDKLEDKVMSKQLEVMEKQQKLEQEMSER